MLADNRQSISLWVSKASPACPYKEQYYDEDEQQSGGVILRRENRSTESKYVPGPFCGPQISHRLSQN